METSNQASVQNLNFIWNIAGFRCQARPAWEFHRFTDLHNLSNITVATLPFCNLASILKLEMIYIFEFQRLIVQRNELNVKGNARDKLRIKPGSELGSEPGLELGSKPGSELGSEPGSEPGLELGSEPGSELGSEPGLTCDHTLPPFFFPSFQKKITPDRRLSQDPS